ncbi:FAD-binding protein, partial [Candidatus Parcubacteria bacterium]|nr:FAD-binding protein [Candidatus Parcubacteria bacterium]
MDPLTSDPAVLEAYSRDASLFKVMPKWVAYPKDAQDIKELIKIARERGTSLTMRAAGSDMSGGPLNEGIVADVTKHMNKVGEVRETYSRDASIFKVLPKWVAFPKSVEDIKALVKEARERGTSLTMRAAGSDMSGGPLNEGIVADVTKHMSKVGEVKAEGTVVQPGVLYREFELLTLDKNLVLPCFPASKNLAALGGMVGNNCGGELSLRYGKMEEWVRESRYVFSDGNEYVVKPLTKAEFAEKIAQNNFEGNIYKQVSELIEQNREAIMAAKPKVSKNSAGYYLWNLWQEEKFDLNRLLTGAQGTLGVMTEATVGLVPVKTHHDLIALFFNSWEELPQVVNTILPFEPESLETF